MSKIINTSLFFIILSVSVITLKVHASAVLYTEEKDVTNEKLARNDPNIIRNTLKKEDIYQSKTNALSVCNAWARASLSSNSNSAIYMSIRNNTGKQITILGAIAPPEVAGSLQLHKSFIDEKGISRMTSVDKIVIPAKSSIDLTPGGIHIMLLDLKRRLNFGDKFQIALQLESMIAMTVVEVTVRNKRQ